MKKNQGFAAIVIILILIAVAIIASTYLLGIKNGSPVSYVISTTLPSMNTSEKTEWKTYTSQDGSVSNSYPSSWVLSYGGQLGQKGTFAGGKTISWWTMEKTITDSKEGKIQVMVNLEKNTSNNPLDSFLDCNINGGCSKITYNGQEYLTNSFTMDGYLISKNYITSHNGKLLYIRFGVPTKTTTSEEYTTIEQIVSTFKFN